MSSANNDETTQGRESMTIISINESHDEKYASTPLWSGPAKERPHLEIFGRLSPMASLNFASSASEPDSGLDGCSGLLSSSLEFRTQDTTCKCILRPPMSRVDAATLAAISLISTGRSFFIANRSNSAYVPYLRFLIWLLGRYLYLARGAYFSPRFRDT